MFFYGLPHDAFQFFSSVFFPFVSLVPQFVILCWYCYLLWRFAIQQQSTAPQSGHALLTQIRSLFSWTLGTMRLISGTLRSTPLPWLPVLSNIEPPALRRKAATDELVKKIVKHDTWPIQPDILNPPSLRLTSRKPLWLDLNHLTTKVDGGITGSRLRWSILT